MGLNQFAPSRHKAFVFTEYLEEGNFEAYSCGTGRFIQAAPSADLEICFTLHKNKSSLNIHIHEDNLLQWLRAIPPLRDDLDNDLFDASVSMGRLLPCYPEMSAKFDQDKIEGHSFDALELFVRHFLREGSVFATFGFEHLLERQILTELHFHDIQSQDRSMSEDLDLLDEAIDKIDERDIKGPNHSLRFMNELFQSQLQTAIKRRDSIAVNKVLAMDQGFVNARTLCLAIRHYERTVFRLLLEHGAQVDGVGIIAEPLYRAAKAGHMDAVQLLLTYGANKEGGISCIRAAPLSGAASGGHLEIVQYLVEEKGANINGNRHKSPLSRAIKHHHTHVIDYLLRVGADVLEESYFMLLQTRQAVLGDMLERVIAGMDNCARDRLFLRAVSEGHFEIVRCLVAASANVNQDMQHCKASVAFWLCDRAHSLPLAVAASKGHLEIVRCLIAAGANVNPDMQHCNAIGEFLRFNQEYSSPLEVATSKGHLEIVRCLIAAGANVNPYTQHCNAAYNGSRPCDREHSSPLAVAASKGHLEIVRCLLAAGAILNPFTWHRDASDGDNSDAKIPRCRRPHYSPLAAAIMSNESEVTQFLSSIGATLLAGEDEIDGLDRPMPAGEFHNIIKDSLNDCPAVAAIQAQERRTMTRRLLAKVANSCEKLLDASTMHDASAGVIAFVDQVGTSASVWRNGTRAIRDICEGYMPRSLSDIISALQVANAMRSVVPPSRLGCSKKEFINDIPRWASLVSPDDQRLFFEIASYLWGTPASTIAHEVADSFIRPLMFLQDIVNHLVRTSGLFDHGSGNSYRLQTLRQQYPFEIRPTHKCEKRRTLAEWNPLPKQMVRESPHTNAPKPPDPEGKEFSILARITVLIAGAIFGAILLYLCLSRYGFSTLCLPILTSDAGQSWASDQIITRNNVILAMYVGFTSHFDFENWKSTDHLLPKPSSFSLVLPHSPLTERVREHMAAIQAPSEGDYPMTDSSSVVDNDTIMGCSPSVASHLTASSPATTISPSSMTTATPGLTPMCTSMDGTVCCEHCNSKFKLGKNGRRGQASNMQKHMKIHHPETIPDYHRVMYKCRYGCGTRDPNKSNIKAHEMKHCANRKGKLPRYHSKWR